MNTHTNGHYIKLQKELHVSWIEYDCCHPLSLNIYSCGFSLQFCVFFLQSHSSHDKLHPKGDVVLENPNVIECVTKLAMIFIETQKRELQLQFKTE